ncbi:MAG TPA: aminotransferase class I/II-fold pyridoxal phosphate-dependent enzyme [Rectinema sp.]|nr:aminotransferase class I/II-fold pyridoxal phosphate-dependent enzyme [Spirochaetia bacterium]NLH90518.1 aminotransferase class I/II-fold pyridoxal phosphate-dependent enzyme [Treponema sp.]OQC74521.1 MAG: putative pyridoxal phosphate-dependent acyltransferase [Spirochaetes bacterium ADurb.Bin001]HNP93382.1 aminotransferase class I/II-fold pyridoxal phosphate-dependent enzyme [Rectinema sp.]HNT59487.1 aminotransferase class I/II-fold pyridoxal phosphate-dependent enzyme [Rectinema sp.]
MDIFQKCFDFDLDKQAMEKGLYPYFRPLDGLEGTEAVFNGRKLIMIGSNNYLGLTMHPKVKEAARKGLEEFGPSCTGSRFLNGTLKLHNELEERLATFVGKEAALVFSTGMQTNLGAISSLVDRNDVVIIDKDDHASIVDGCRLSMGEMKRYLHADLDHLERILQKVPSESGTMVVVDGVFSMGGDIVDLPGLVRLCQKYGARLYVDDAHSIGVLGDGHGTAWHFGLTDKVDIIMGTFSKSFASLGGFVAGDRDVINYIKHTARSFMFSASLPAPNTMAALAALDIMETEPEHVKHLWDNANFMMKGFRELGFNIGKTQTPIIPVIIGEDETCFRFWKELFDEGLYTNPVISPAVPEGMALLRTSYMATHTREQLQRALDIFEKAGRKFGII